MLYEVITISAQFTERVAEIQVSPLGGQSGVQAAVYINITRLCLDENYLPETSIRSGRNYRAGSDGLHGLSLLAHDRNAENFTRNIGNLRGRNRPNDGRVDFFGLERPRIP